MLVSEFRIVSYERNINFADYCFHAFGRKLLCAEIETDKEEIPLRAFVGPINNARKAMRLRPGCHNLHVTASYSGGDLLKRRYPAVAEVFGIGKSKIESRLCLEYGGFASLSGLADGIEYFVKKFHSGKNWKEYSESKTAGIMILCVSCDRD